MRPSGEIRRLTATPSITRFLAAVPVLILVAAVVLLARGSLRLDYYYDEALRADMIRTPWTWSRYRLHDTPIPPGWLASMWAVFSAVPARRPLIRLVALLPTIVAVAVTYDLVRRVCAGATIARQSDGRGPRRSSAAALTIVGLGLCAPLAAQIPTYLNNYGTDLMIVSLIMWAVWRFQHENSGNALHLLIACAAIGPFIAQSGTFVLPAAVLVVGNHHRNTRQSQGPKRRGFGIEAWLLMLTITSALVCYLGFLRTVRSGSGLAEFWSSDTISGVGWPHAPSRLWATFLDQGIPRAVRAHSLGTGAYLLLGVFGAVITWRIWRTAVWCAIAAQAASLIGSAAIGWPFSVVRVNAGYLWIVFQFVGVGVVGALTCVSSRLAGAATPRSARRLGNASIAVVGVALVGAVWPRDVIRNAASTEPFARGLSADLEHVVAGGEDGDVVVDYHAMSAWYVHDRLVNGPAPHFRFIDELTAGDSMYTALARLLADETPGASRVWCIVPFDLGPKRSDEACHIDEASWKLVDDERLQRAEIKLYVSAR